MKQQTQGIFIHKTPYSESSLIVTFFTEDAGVQRFLYQGGKKKAAALYPCSVCELTFYKRPDSDLGKLTEAHATLALQQIPFNPVHSTVAFFIADLMRNVLKSEDEDRSMFRFLVDSLEKLDLLNEQELSLAIVYFLLKLSDKLGIEPQTEASHKRYFLPTEGVFSDIERMDTITCSGPGVTLVQNLLMEEQMTHVSIEAKREALDLLLMYFQLHLPSFKVNRTLEVIREILYH